MSETTFSAILNRITTTLDGGWRISFDVPKRESKEIMELSQMRNVVLQLGVVPHHSPEDAEDD